MKTLISPAEVISIAFGTTHTLRPESVPIHTILSAERRLLRPVVGEQLCNELALDAPSEPYVSLFENYLKLPLALYAAYLALPAIAAQVGTAGVVRLRGEGFEPLDDHSVERLRRRLKADADALLDTATDHLAANPDLYPLYDPSQNVRSRISLKGGVCL